MLSAMFLGLFVFGGVICLSFASLMIELDKMIASSTLDVRKVLLEIRLSRVTCFIVGLAMCLTGLLGWVLERVMNGN